MSMTQVLIDGHAYRLISSYKTSRKNTLPKHPMENGVSYSDHIEIGAPSFDLSLTLFSGEYETLTALATAQRLFTLVLPDGVYNNCAVKTLSDATNNSANTTTAALSIEVQKVTNTETRPTELDGISMQSPNTDGLTAVPVAKDYDSLTIKQYTEYYLSKLSPISRYAEREKLKNMSNDEIWDYLVATMEELETVDAMRAIEYDEGGLRKYIDIDQSVFSDSTLLYKSYAFTHTFNAVETSYYLDIRKENPVLGEMTWGIQTLAAAALFPSAVVLSATGRTILPYHYHIIIRRVRDNAVMYNGVLLDLTPFTMNDPDTGQTVATLQYSEFWSKIYIA